MQKREEIIRLWFNMWLLQKDMGIDDIFAEDAVYIESWGPKYENRTMIKHWFEEWNTRGRVVLWDITQYFHDENQTVVEWIFKNVMNDGSIENFDGITLIKWTADGKISFLKEFGCNLNTYNPYQNGKAPQFRDENVNWF